MRDAAFGPHATPPTMTTLSFLSIDPPIVLKSYRFRDIAGDSAQCQSETKWRAVVRGSPLSNRPDDRPEFLQQLTRFLFSRLERQSAENA